MRTATADVMLLATARACSTSRRMQCGSMPARRLAALTAIAVLAWSSGAPPTLSAQEGTRPTANIEDPGFAVHALLGAFLPVGAHRRTLDPAAYVGAQVAVRLRRWVAIVAGGAGTQTSDDRLRPADDGITLWQYDAGLELAPWSSVEVPVSSLRFVPFLGGGIGGRSYDFDQRGVETHTALTGYLSAGGELHLGGDQRTGVRIESRAYSSHAEGSARGQRTDIILAAGLAYHFR